ncbi:hypothetical protein OROGR_024566 [Orobanche gracilis]
MAPLLIFITLLSAIGVPTIAENRAHGLDNESPMTLSPSAYTFFNPNTRQPSANPPCGPSECSTLPFATTVQSSPACGRASKGSNGFVAGGIVGIPLVFIFACLITAGAYYVGIKRRAKSRRADPQQVVV